MSTCDESDIDLDAAIEQAAGRFEKEIALGDDPATPYKPFITAVRARSRGYSYRTPGIITGRTHHNLSRGEEGVLQLFDIPEENTNIREQFAVPPSLTWWICKKRDWRHPFHEGAPAVLSVDFLINSRRRGRIAVDFKKQGDLEHEDTRRKLAIVAEALRLVGVPHEIMTEVDLPRVLLRNLRFLHQLALPFDPPPLSQGEFATAEDRLRAILRSGRTVIFDAAIQVSAKTGIPARRLSRGALWCIAQRRWTVDLNRPVGPDCPVIFLK